MKKGTKITRVTIHNGKVTAYARIKNGDEFILPLTRAQRNIFLRHNQSDFHDQLMNEFKTDILSDSFKIES